MTKLTVGPLLAALVSIAAAGNATAQAAPEALPLWELGVAGGAATTPAYPGSSDRTRRGLLLPMIVYRGEVFRSDQGGIGARLVNSDRYEFDIGLAGSLPADSDDVAARAGMPDLGTLLEFGPRLKIKLANPSPSTRLAIELPLRAVIEARNGFRQQGFTFEPELTYNVAGPRGLWTMGLNLSLVAGDSKINRYFYEVAPVFATAQRSAYQADAGLMLVRVGANASRKLGPDVRMFGFARYDSYASAANKDSPLMRRNNGISAGLGFSWTLKRSAERAK